MAHGGYRPGAGRKRGSLTAKTREIAEAASAGGITPLEYMLSVLRNELADPKERFAAATAAAPYIHPRLAAVEHSGDMTLHHEDALSELDGEGEAGPPETA
jgi:hypothetical protein